MPQPITVHLDKAKLDRIAHDLPTAVDKVVGQIAFNVQGDAQASFGSGPAGITYKRGNISHTASAPPGPPAVDTGALRDSIVTEHIKQGEWHVQDGVEYGAFLEYGTPHMAARPWLYPAVFRAAQLFNKMFGKAFK